jgi:hypothetical protein
MTIRAIPADTSPDAFHVLVHTYRAMPGSRRLELALALSDAIQEMGAAGIRQRHPEYTDRQVRRQLARRRLGDDVAELLQSDGFAMSQPAFFQAIIDLLEHAGIPFMVTGSYGSSHHGMPRTTNDLDIVIDPTADQLAKLCTLPAERFYVSAAAAQDALRHRYMFNVIDTAGGYKVDFIIRKDRPFSLEEFARRRPAQVQGRTVYVASAEDIILSKLEWNLQTPSERQVQDALDVAIVQWPQLDRVYLRRWASELGVAESLAAILEQAGGADQPPP